MAGLGAGVADAGSGMGGVALRHLGVDFNGVGLFLLLPVHVFRFTVLPGGAHPRGRRGRVWRKRAARTAGDPKSCLVPAAAAAAIRRPAVLSRFSSLGIRLEARLVLDRRISQLQGRAAAAFLVAVAAGRHRVQLRRRRGVRLPDLRAGLGQQGQRTLLGVQLK